MGGMGEVGGRSKREGYMYIIYIYIYMADSHCCTAETNTTMESKYS